MYGEILDKEAISAYQPSTEVIEITKPILKDYATGEDILNRPYTELNGRTVIEDENRGQLMFNAFVDTSVEDPNEAWKWRGTRSMARNKGIAMHANLTANYLLPLFVAQNDADEVDRDFSEVMRDIIEWMAEPTNSNYQSSFLQIVFAMETNPVTYLAAEYCEVFQKIKEKSASGEYTTKEILDTVLSGFQAPIYSASQVLITNAFERNMQRQRRVIKRRYCEISELEAKYGEHPNWGYVKPGIKSIYNDENGIYYDVKDEDSRTHLVAEEIALCRRDDSEIPYINGIYMGDDNVENNPIKHRDQRNAPKYNIVPFGFYRIGEHFFFYKSMMNAMGWDNMYYDAMSEIVMNRAILEVEMPIAISGSDKIDSDIIFPNAVVTFENADAKVNSLLPNSNMVAGFNALRETEKSMNEGSVNETISGNLPEASQKAYSVAQAQANSKKLISGVGKSLAASIVSYGDLMKDIAINNTTAPQVDELVGGGMKLKYRSFLLDKKSSAGKQVTKKIMFDETLIGSEMTDQEKKEAKLKLLETTGYPDHKMSLARINPEMFAKFNYLTKCDVEEMFVKNQEYWQPVLTNLVQMLATNPYIEQEALTRELMYSYFQSRGDDFVKKEVSMMQGNPAIPGGATNPLGEMVKAKQLGAAATGAISG